MLAANVCASDFLAKKKHPVLYRIHEGPTPEKLAALRAFLADRLAPFKQPRLVHAVGALPRNALGKVQKHRLRGGRIAEDS
jgi:acyl-coenzyme A synthetase/AMP-(fatty) acid ligase